MFKKISITVICFFSLLNLGFAQPAKFCAAAKDSMKAQFKRGEMACYILGNAPSKMVTFIKISENNYEKRVIKFGTKDTSELKKYKALVERVNKIDPNNFDPNNPSKTIKNDNQIIEQYVFSPNDTSYDFKTCYNIAFQPKLDSAFKCDFFRKSDSILRSYDKLGKGYRAVEYPGGANALSKFLEKNISLPKNAKVNDKTNTIRVYYSFFIDEVGKINDLKVVKSNCPECEESVKSAITKMPAFIPAIDAGKPKRVKYILPFTKKI